MKKVTVTIELDRDKILDEGIFLALCAQDHLKNVSYLTGNARLKLAYHKIGIVIEEVEKRIGRGEFVENKDTAFV